MNSEQPRTPLQKALEQLRRAACLAAVAVCAMPVLAQQGQQAETPTLPETVVGEADAEANDMVIVTVNGSEITQQEISQAADQMVYQQLMQFGGQQANFPPQQLQQLRQQAMQGAREQMINQKLLEQYQAENQVEVSDERVEERIEELREMIRLNAPDSSLEEFLTQRGVTMDELQDQFREMLKMEVLLEQHSGASLEPTDEEVQAFYEENKARFEEPASIDTSHILIGFPGNPRDSNFEAPDEATKAGLKQQAQELLEQAQGGADFAELAREHSTGPSAPRGGALGPTQQGQLVPAYEQAVEGLEEGQVAPEVVETQFGYHVIKLNERNEGGQVPFEEVEQSIRGRLTEQKMQETLTALVEELREGADIVVVNELSTGTTNMPPQLQQAPAQAPAPAQ